MLAELYVENLAIIESLRLEFAPGLNVLTGETGAGKSIIIDAVGLLLGGRASAELVRTDCDTAVVEGIFALSPEQRERLKETLETYGLYDESGELIVRREVSRERRASCRVNGRAVPLAVLEELGRHLIDVHGQGDHLMLLQPRHHIDYIDRFGALMMQREAFGVQVAELRRVRAEISHLRDDERELARRADLLRYQADEIAAARLQAGEEDDLGRERTRLANAEKLAELAAEVYGLLADSERSTRTISDMLGAVVSDLTTLAELDPRLTEQHQRAESALYELDDLAHLIRSYADEIASDPERLSEIEERLGLIRALQRKYGDSIEQVLAYGERAQRELDTIEHCGERLEALEAAEGAVLARLGALGTALSQRRKQAAQALAERIERELADLDMARARFLVDVRWESADDGVPVDGARRAFGATGLDRVEFLIAPNVGEAPQSLARTASGGETSRLMLAMKNALAASDIVPTLIFDEIDAGIGGRTGDIVGKKLWTLARNHQVFCVTHLAQMACYGERHLRVAKTLANDRTVSVVTALTPDERVDELAMMLGGAVTEATRKSAEELLQRAGQASA
ncbi:MAG: DNA repair protein RecN [Chloroflexi bacterium]|nr:DNA repair protein RecN [Chloroflexota bacterium]